MSAHHSLPHTQCHCHLVITQPCTQPVSLQSHCHTQPHCHTCCYTQSRCHTFNHTDPHSHLPPVTLPHPQPRCHTQKSCYALNNSGHTHLQLRSFTPLRCQPGMLTLPLCQCHTDPQRHTDMLHRGAPTAVPATWPSGSLPQSVPRRGSRSDHVISMVWHAAVPGSMFEPNQSLMGVTHPRCHGVPEQPASR